MISPTGDEERHPAVQVEAVLLLGDDLVVVEDEMVGEAGDVEELVLLDGAAVQEVPWVQFIANLTDGDDLRCNCWHRCEELAVTRQLLEELQGARPAATLACESIEVVSLLGSSLSQLRFDPGPVARVCSTIGDGCDSVLEGDGVERELLATCFMMKKQREELPLAEEARNPEAVEVVELLLEEASNVGDSLLEVREESGKAAKAGIRIGLPLWRGPVAHDVVEELNPHVVRECLLRFEAGENVLAPLLDPVKQIIVLFSFLAKECGEAAWALPLELIVGKQVRHLHHDVVDLGTLPFRARCRPFLGLLLEVANRQLVFSLDGEADHLREPLE